MVTGPGPDVVIWWLDASRVGADDRLLADRERRRAAQMSHASTRRTFVVAAALVRLAVGARINSSAADVMVDRSCPDCSRWHGRPRIVSEARVEISVSHSGDRVGVAVGLGLPAQLGLDVEAIARMSNPRAAQLIRATLDEHEQRALRGSVALAADFGTYWVRKEAILKATGLGLRCAPASLRVSAPHVPPRLEQAADGLVDRTALHTLLADDDLHVAAIAAVSPAGAARVEFNVQERDGAELVA